MPNGKIWIQGTTVMMRGGKIVFSKNCPCDCRPRVLHSYTTNASNPDRKCWDLRPFQGPDEGTPFTRWRLIEVSEDHDCSGIHYGEGDIDECGRLVGLSDEFCSTYNYDGYMEIQQGCFNADRGQWEWPCPEESGRRWS